MVILLRITNDLIGKAVRNHPLKSPLALAIEAVIPGRLEAVCREHLYLKPDIEIRLPKEAILMEDLYDRTGICFEYLLELDLESNEQNGIQLAVLCKTSNEVGANVSTSPPASA